ncbi:bifunctional aminoglycoside phosphotransferase/ATP-binding protein [Xanthobacter sp. TB0139]|uniref:bifunctional aminoglycoside phosphotransferase/ATP-binding protein n=1 Tax=Xanthobacter sp. TB0139 TaxID=3459178 RepID=UPI004039F3A8
MTSPSAGSASSQAVQGACLPNHVVADQSVLFAFLAEPQAHDLPPDTQIQQIHTHGAAVFLAGPFAYKVKRAVYFPFMDFSTLEKRKVSCEAELRIGKTNAPDLYLDVVPITRGANGALHLGGMGDVVDYAVKMRRFDTAHTLDKVTTERDLTSVEIKALARAIVASHVRAPVVHKEDPCACFEDFLSDNRAEFTARPALFPPAQTEALCTASEQAFAHIRPLLRVRGKAGYVRRCHGDLHLRNIVLLDDAPVLFDAIEFNEEIATCDTLYDLAFLLMDLWQRGLFTTANRVFNRYLWEAQEEGHLEGLSALPFFLSMRAAIRAKVEAAGLDHLSAEARTAAEQRIRHLFQTALLFLKPESCTLAPDTFHAGERMLPALPQAAQTPGPHLVAIGGLSGTGKSTCAMAWAPFIGRPPGALVLRSDVERKHLFQTAETEPLPAEAYEPQATQRVYARLCALAARALASGQSVIVDAVHARPYERLDVERVAQAAGLPFIGIWLEADLSVRVNRVEQRRGDASDADAAVARQQQSYDLGDMNWTRLKSG